MNALAIKYGVVSVGKHILRFAKKYAPQIMVGLGIAGFAGTAVASGKAALEIKETLDKKDREIANLQVVGRDKDIPEVKRKTRWKLVKIVIKPVTLGAASAMLVLGGNHILSRRAAEALSLAYEAQMKLQKKEEQEKLAEGGTDGNDISGPTETDKKQRKPREDEEWVTVDWLFCEATCGSRFGGSGCWHENSEMNLSTVINHLNRAQDRLRATGHITINQILTEEFGADPISDGELGYLWDEKYGHDDIDVQNPAVSTVDGRRQFLLGEERDILLRFRVRREPIARKFDEINWRKRNRISGNLDRK